MNWIPLLLGLLLGYVVGYAYHCGTEFIRMFLSKSDNVGEYRSPSGALYEFNGWKDGESPVELWTAKNWAGCLHACMFATFLLNDRDRMAAYLADDGLLHELLHLTVGAPICSRRTMADLKAEVRWLQTHLANKRWSDQERNELAMNTSLGLTNLAQLHDELKATRDDVESLIGVADDLVELLGGPPPPSNCLCAVTSPPCGDCVENSHYREVYEFLTDIEARYVKRQAKES